MSATKAKRNGVTGLDAYGRGPIHLAAAEGRSEDVARLLADGADPNAQDHDGWSPLHFAAQATAVATTRLLLGAGADPRLRDAFGNTALWRAVMSSRGDGSVIGLLRKASADPYAANSSGISPVQLARSIANYDVAQFFADCSEG